MPSEEPIVADDSYLAAARERWPDLAIAPSRFAAYLAARSGEGAPPVAYAADLYLACACADGADGAAETFQRAYEGELARAIGRVNADPAFVADAMQITLERLLLPREDAPPRIAEYAGRSSLAAWLASAAARVALNLRRNKSEQAHDEVRSDAMVHAITPEIAMMRARYKGDLEAAIRAALRSLSSRERALLRLHLAERMSIDRLAVVYGIGRSTAARWLAAARTSLADATRARFCEQVGVPSAEFDSIAAALRSDLDVSLVSHLVSRDDAR